MSLPLLIFSWTRLKSIIEIKDRKQRIGKFLAAQSWTCQGKFYPSHYLTRQATKTTSVLSPRSTPVNVQWDLVMVREKRIITWGVIRLGYYEDQLPPSIFGAKNDQKRSNQAVWQQLPSYLFNHCRSNLKSIPYRFVSLDSLIITAILYSARAILTQQRK